MKISWRRVWGIMLRHLYNFIHTWDRLTDAFYWATLDILVWGLAISAIQKQGGTQFGSQVSTILIGLILWYMLWRAQYEITVNFLEELWSDNLGNLFSTPLTMTEWTVGMLLLGVSKLFLTVTFTATIAYIFYGVNLLRLGIYFFPFAAILLIFGWTFGFFLTGLFMRFGTQIQTFAWAGAAVIMPFSATFWPLAVLPGWLKNIAVALPSTYVFESMRSLINKGVVNNADLSKGFLLAAIYFILALAFFIKSFKKAKEVGLTNIK